MNRMLEICRWSLWICGPWFDGARVVIQMATREAWYISKSDREPGKPLATNLNLNKRRTSLT